MSGMSPIGRALKVFYSYARQDKQLRDQLEKHLSGLRRQGIIASWENGEIEVSSERDVRLKKYLSLSDIILLLISPDFIESDNCYGVEMKQALERHERGEASVIPIILRPTDTYGLPFAFLQFLPPEGKPVTKWRPKDDAFVMIARSLRKLIKEIGEKLPSEPVPTEATSAPPAWWKVPYPQNPFFTGRASILERLHAAFLAKKTGVFVQTLNGLGGIGKTQIALEYVYQYVQAYRAIFWVAADPQGDLLADFVSIAQFLHLPEKDELNHTLIVAAIKLWLELHDEWLLIFDNVEDVTAVNAFRPVSGNGHLLITTRAQAIGNIATPQEVEPMDIQEGAQFLLKRVRLSSQDMPPDQMEVQKKAAEEIARLFDGHPLALDQAGGYVEETGQRLSDYLNLYQQRQGVLLSRRGDTSKDHPNSVMTTFLLAFESVERMRPDAAELLRFCAFLHPDAIPEELLMVGALFFDPAYQNIARDPYELDAALAALRKYSLIKRNPATKTVSVHRLVQDVLKSGMDEEQQRHWAESMVRTLSQEFPYGEFESWPICLRYLPHARIALHLLEEWQMRFIAAVHLLDNVGHYLYKRAEYAEARVCYEQALNLLAEEEEPLLTAQILSNLGVLHIMLSHYPEAESYLRRALQIREQILEPAHPDLGESLNDLAGVYHNQGKLAEAEPLYWQALTIQEQTLGAEDPATVRTLGNLALLEYSQKKYAESEELNKRALAARERRLGVDHVDTGQSMLNLAYAYYQQQKYTEAEPLFERALTIYEGMYGPEHPQTAGVLHGLGLLYNARKRYEEAEQHFQRVLPVFEKTYGSEHPRIAGVLTALATISIHKGRPEEAEQLVRQAMQIREQRSWLEEIDFASKFRDIAHLYESQKKYEQAKSLYQLVITLRQRTLGEEHQDVAAAHEEYTSFLSRREKKDAVNGSNDGD